MQKRQSVNIDNDDLEIFHLSKHNKRFLEQLSTSKDSYRLAGISLNDYMLWTITLTKGVDGSIINIQGPHGKNILIESSDQYDFFLNSLLQVLDTNNLRLFHWFDKYALSNWGLVKEE